jgi:hypothetical protein
MNIFDYHDFLSDVKLYFAESFEKFNLNVNLALNSIEKPVNNFVFLENKYCIVCLDNITSFPYPDITTSFYIKDESNLIELNQNKLWGRVNLNEEIIAKFCNFHQAKFEKSNDFLDDTFGSYRYGLKLNNDLLIQFFSSLFSGNIPKNELINMVVNK